MLDWIPYGALAYLLGSIPFGKLIARKVARIDISKRGSGNIGATNVAREVGLGWGLLTLVLDALKGALPVALFLSLSRAGDPVSQTWASWIGLSALLGHQFSLFQGLRGGKGVATALGVYLVISPAACLLALPLFLVIVYRWDYVSLGSMAGAAGLPVFLAVLGKPCPAVALAGLAAALIVLKHAANIRRLLRGEELKWRRQTDRPRDPEAGRVPHGSDNG